MPKVLFFSPISTRFTPLSILQGFRQDQGSILRTACSCSMYTLSLSLSRNPEFFGVRFCKPLKYFWEHWYQPGTNFGANLILKGPQVLMILRATPSSSCLQFPLDMSRRKTEQKFIRAIHHGATAIKIYKIGKETIPKIYDTPRPSKKNTIRDGGSTVL